MWRAGNGALPPPLHDATITYRTEKSNQPRPRPWPPRPLTHVLLPVKNLPP